MKKTESIHVKNDLQWYYDRVGKRIRRVNGNNGCKCPVCNASRTLGLVVHNKIFAEYLFDLQEEQEYRYVDMDILLPVISKIKIRGSKN